MPSEVNDEDMSSGCRQARTLMLLAPVVLAPTLGTLSALWFWPGTLGSVIYGGCKSVLYGVPFIVCLRSHANQRPGFTCRPAWLLAGLGSGAVIGGLMMALWFFWLEATTDTSSLIGVAEENGLTDPVKFWVFGAWLCIGNSFLEEFAFRWFVDSRLRMLGADWSIVVPISAAIFTLHHVFVLSAYFDLGMTVLGSAGVFAGGMIWSVLRLKSKSLIPGWISHGLVDLAIILIGASVLGI